MLKIMGAQPPHAHPVPTIDIHSRGIFPARSREWVERLGTRLCICTYMQRCNREELPSAEAEYRGEVPTASVLQGHAMLSWAWAPGRADVQ